MLYLLPYPKEIMSPSLFSGYHHPQKNRGTLRRSQHYFERAQEVGNMGNWRLDLQKNELIWSDENYKIFGVEKGVPRDI